jgi:hypothetical protein
MVPERQPETRPSPRGTAVFRHFQLIADFGVADAQADARWWHEPSGLRRKETAMKRMLQVVLSLAVAASLLVPVVTEAGGDSFDHKQTLVRAAD